MNAASSATAILLFNNHLIKGTTSVISEMLQQHLQWRSCNTRTGMQARYQVRKEQNKLSITRRGRSAVARAEATNAGEESHEGATASGASLAVQEAGRLKDTEAVPLRGQVRVPGKPGVYAVYDPSGELQFVGISRKLSRTISEHLNDLPELCGSIKFVALTDADRASLQSAWRAWIEEYVQDTNSVPPGNQPGETKWTKPRTRDTASAGSSNERSDIKLTPGKGADDLTVSIKELVDQIIKDHHVVAFTKGNKQQPQCGFSHQVMTALRDTGVDFEVVDVLDETHNPGLREAIKEYTYVIVPFVYLFAPMCSDCVPSVLCALFQPSSDWPTIPQVFVDGEFIGGCATLYSDDARSCLFLECHGYSKINMRSVCCGNHTETITGAISSWICIGKESCRM